MRSLLGGSAAQPACQYANAIQLCISCSVDWCLQTLHSNSNSNSTNTGMISKGLLVARSVQVFRLISALSPAKITRKWFHAVAVVSSVCPRGWSIGSRSATGFCPEPIEAPDLRLKRAGPRSRWCSSACRKCCINEHGSGDTNFWNSDTSRN